jgi:hypothetical protein
MKPVGKKKGEEGAKKDRKGGSHSIDRITPRGYIVRRREPQQGKKRWRQFRRHSVALRGPKRLGINHLAI